MSPSSHILLVDDNEDMLSAMSDLFASLGHRTSTASTATECYGKVSEQAPDLILLDVILPDGNGIEICRKIRTESRFSSTSIILISGQVTGMDGKLAGFAAGADEYIQRPVEARELMAKVGAMLRRQNELRTLRSAQDLWRSIIHGAPDFILTLAPNGVIQFVNHTVPDLRPEDVIGRSVFDFIAVEYHAEWRQAMETAALAGEAPPFESVGRGAGGVPTWFWIRLGTIRRRGRPDSFIALCEDISKRKQAERNQSRLADILNHTTDFVGTATPEGRILYINPAGRRMLGLAEAEDLSGAHIQEFIREGASAGIEQGAVASAIEKGIWSGENLFLHRSGREIPVSQVVIAHRDRGGVIGYISTLARDISERKATELQIRQLNQDLERRVAVRTAQLGIVNARLQRDIALRKHAEESLQASENRLRRQNRALTVMASQKEFTGVDLSAVLHRIVEEAARALRLDSASVWLLSRDGTTYQRRQIFKRSDGPSFEGGDLLREQFAHIEQALGADGVISIADVPFPNDKPGAPGGNPLESQSGTLLCSAIRIGSRYAGMLLLHTRKSGHEWALDERMFACAVGNVVAEALKTEELHISEERNQIVTQTTHDVVWDWDLSSNIVWVNGNLERLFGYPSSDGSHPLDWWMARIHPHERDDVWGSLRAYIETGGNSWTRTHRFLKQDGAYARVLNRSSVLRDPLGRVVRVIGALSDVTEQTRIQESLRNVAQRIMDVQEAERRRVARELHDSVNQLLSSARFRIQAIESRAGAIDPELLAEAVKAHRLLEQAVREVRRISQNLRPSELDDFGIAAAIRSACDEFRDRTGASIHSVIRGVTKGLSPEIELALYRIVQEGLSNVAKHAAADHVTLQMEQLDGNVMLTIRDDGRGLSEGSAESAQPPGGSGFGLTSMRERAILAGGSFEILSPESGGTEIRVNIPLSRRTGFQTLNE
jgi:PAS domain S-box-containing protein